MDLFTLICMIIIFIGLIINACAEDKYMAPLSEYDEYKIEEDEYNDKI